MPLAPVRAPRFAGGRLTPSPAGIFPAKPGVQGIGLFNTAEGGSNGSTVTQGSAGNSGKASGDFFDTVTASAVTFDTSITGANGSLVSYKFSGSTTNILAWTNSLFHGSSNAARVWPVLYVAMDLYLDTLPAAAFDFCSLQNGGLSASMAVSTSGVVTLKDKNAATQATFTTTLSAATWYRIELQSFSATSGFMVARLYSPESGTSYTEQQIATAVNTSHSSTSPGFNTVQFGITTVPTSAVTFHMDNVGLSSTSWVGNGVTTSALFPSADNGAAADAGETVHVSDTDSGAFAEASSISAALSSADTGTAAEGTAQIGVTNPDTGSGADSSQLTIAAADTGTAAEGTAAVAVASADTLTGAEGAPQVGAASADTGAGADGGESVSVQAADTGAAAEGTAAAGVASADAMAGAEGAPAQVTIAAGDTGAGAEGAPPVAVASADTLTGAEGVAALSVLSADTAGSAETQAAAAAVASADTGTAAEGVALLTVASADTGVIAETYAAARPARDVAVTAGALRLRWDTAGGQRRWAAGVRHARWDTSVRAGRWEENEDSRDHWSMGG